MEGKFYYQIHVLYSRNNGYSTAIESDRELTDDEAIEQAHKEGKLSDGDGKYVDEVTPNRQGRL